jgi:transposase
MESSMITKQAEALAILAQLAVRGISQAEAATKLHRSIRQVKRMLRAYRQDGAGSLASKQRGKVSNRQLAPDLYALIVERCRGPYLGFGPQFASEKLKELDNICVSKETVRKILIAEKLWKAKQRRRNLHPSRIRRPRFGELVQADGSPHHWFDDRGPYCTLLLMVDDATSRIGNGLFAPTETTAGYFDLLHGYLIEHGRSEAMYTDRHSIFRVSGESKVKQNETSFGKALDTLGIELICANSPQAKGRVERANRTLQDRLVKELRLRNISTIEHANSYLPTFIAEHNRKFAREPEEPENAHASIDGFDLDAILVVTEERKLDRNLCLQFENKQYRLVDDYSRKCLRRGVRITIEQRRDGTMHMRDSKRYVQFEYVEERKMQGTIMDAKEIGTYRNQEKRHTGHKPPTNHPWRGKFARPVEPQTALAA